MRGEYAKKGRREIQCFFDLVISGVCDDTMVLSFVCSCHNVFG
jgi:hypothetical protein